MTSTIGPPTTAIMATGLRKSFGDHTVLDGIDLAVQEGTIFALLGPNEQCSPTVGFCVALFCK